MTTYANLTNEQKSILQNSLNLIRAWAGEQARTNNHGEAINDDYNAQTLTVITELDALEVIPNTSGLAGAVSITKEEMITLVSHVQNMQADMSTHTGGFNTPALRQVWTKAAGAENLIG
jgi:hypothetical protein